MPTIKVIDQGEVEFEGQFSLLEALDEAGFDISYSCRGGHCGACEVKLLSGKVETIQDPSYDPDTGKILACCVIPDGNIVIETL